MYVLYIYVCVCIHIYISKEIEINTPKRYQHAYGHCRAQKSRHGINLSVHKWINEQRNLGHVHSGILFSNKEKKILLFTMRWMNLVDFMLSKIS
jgi:hypothetical protein